MNELVLVAFMPDCFASFIMFCVFHHVLRLSSCFASFIMFCVFHHVLRLSSCFASFIMRHLTYKMAALTPRSLSFKKTAFKALRPSRR